MGHYKTEAWVSVMDKALMIVFCGSLLLLPLNFKMEWFIWAQTMSLLITVFIAAWFSRDLIDRSETSVTSEPVLLVFKDTLPFALTTLLMFIYTRSDSILIGKLMTNGEYHAGVYAAGYRLLDAANMIAYLFSPLLLPIFARMHQQREETLQLIRVSGGLMVFMVFTTGFAGFWWAADIMSFLYGQVSEEWITTFQLLILSHIPIGLMYVFGTYLTALQQLRQMNRWFLLSVLLSIGLNFWLIPRWGTVGAAATAVIVQTLTTCGLIYFWKMHLNVKWNWVIISRVVVGIVLMGIAGWGLASLSMYWILELLLFILFCLCCAFIFRLIQWDLIMNVLRQRGEIQLEENPMEKQS
jgi:O-antigen/teichoic acid export membrane protein